MKLSAILLSLMVAVAAAAASSSQSLSGEYEDWCRGDDHDRIVICVGGESGEGQENESLQDKSLCYSLDSALEQMPDERDTNTVLCIKPGEHVLDFNYTFEGFHRGMAIVGNGTDQPVINCSYGTGLTFHNSSNVVLSNLIFNGCGLVHNSTNLNVTSETLTKDAIPYHAGIYISFCINVTVSRVDLCHSKGIGLVLYDTTGSVIVRQSSFSNGSQFEKDNLGGGGGMSIEFSGCIPGSKVCENISEEIVNYTTHSDYKIIDSVFAYNKAYRSGSKLYKFTNQFSDSYNLGNGAGLSLVLKGNASFNHFSIQSCSFVSNLAHYGAGFYIAFFDNSYNNSVDIVNCNVTGNQNFDAFIPKFDIDANGGGGMIFYVSGKEGRNDVSISDCFFEDNQGLSGAALSVQAISNYRTLSGFLNLSGNTFRENSAYIGSGIYFFRDGFMDSRHDLVVYLSDSEFIANIPLCLKLNKWYYASMPCTGIIYTSNQKLHFLGNIYFSSNMGICIKALFASLVVESGAVMTFSNNTGDKGTAFSLNDCSYIKIKKNTSLIFDRNHASQYGGAIYSAPCPVGISQTTALSSLCFISYDNISTHPDNWNTSLVFTNNTAELKKPNMSAIHADTLTSCWWPKTPDSYLVSPETTFCWKTFHFEGSNCNDSVRSGPQFMEYPNKDIIKYPGEALPLPVMRNGKKEIVTEVSDFKACVVDDKNLNNMNGKGSLYEDCSTGDLCKDINTSSPIPLYYCGKHQNGNVETGSFVLISMSTSEQLTTTTYIEFKSCQWPYQMDDSDSYCTMRINHFCCGKETICNDSSCSINSWLTPKLTYCVSEYNHSNKMYEETDYVIGQCPISYSNLTNHFKYEQLIQGSLSFCNCSHTGFLCGQCVEGKSIPVDSIYFECVDCKGQLLKGWFILIFCQFLPLTLLTLLIALLNIKLTIGIVCGFVIYSQLISIQLPGWYYPPWLCLNDGSHLGDDRTSFYITSTYSPVNLNFLNFFNFKWPWNVCISENMTPIAVVSFGYIVALFPMLLTGLLFLWVTLYDKGIFLVVKLTVPMHRRLARFWRYFGIEPSLIQTVSSVYVLSSMQLIAVSLKLLCFSSWQSLVHKDVKGHSFFYDASLQYFGWPHAFFGMFAIAVLFFFVVLPIIFLLFYQCSCFHKLLDCLKLRYQLCVTIGDAFTGPFKDGTKNRVDFRYTSGLYFLFRLISMCLFYIDDTRYILYSEIALSGLFAAFIMIFRPFRRTIVNFAEFIVFFNLGLMAGLCLAFQESGRKACLYAIMHIPTILLALYVIVLLFKRLKQYQVLVQKKAKEVASKFTRLSDSETDSECQSDVYDGDSDYNDVPDRVLNPSKYSERHVPYCPPETTPLRPHFRLPSFANTSTNSRVAVGGGSIKNTDSDYGSANNN